jgi:hypothetical protein
MRWRVEIADVTGDPETLRDVLERLLISIVAARGKRFLVSDLFEAQDSARGARALASHIGSTMTEASKTDPEIQLGFTLGAVFEQSSDGVTRKYDCAEVVAHINATETSDIWAIRVRTVSPAEAKRLEDVRREQERERVRRKTIPWMVAACQNPRALQVQRLLAAELMPLTMGHIVALIQADIGGAIKDLVKPSTRLERLERSINHSAVYGKDARHIVPDKEPPARPMEIDEARVFIRELADRWFDRIAEI